MRCPDLSEGHMTGLVRRVSICQLSVQLMVGPEREGGERFEEAQVILDKNLFRKPPLVLIIRGYTARCISVYVCVQTRA